ncbi:hypothetical protein RCG24_03880 [Neobacillus sp. OS1-32]|nr:hypothetical protein [Neobacillus sp. OS1-32]WML31043.1 hypothetical protein RCG24_03880 [Neobacillus sp. OS1-32]
MEPLLIDIDTLLDATINLTADGKGFSMEQIEIDRLLDCTED